MQTERKFRIDKYLEMARLTKSLEKREAFVDMAELYLESSESDFETENIQVSGFEYIQGKGREDFLGKKFVDCYNEYSNWCLKNSKRAVSKIIFSKKIRGTFNLTSKVLKREGRTCQCFVLPE